MYNMPRFISVFRLKFVRVVRHLWILSVSQPNLTFRELVKKCEKKEFFILFVLVAYKGNQTTTRWNIHLLIVDCFKKS